MIIGVCPILQFEGGTVRLSGNTVGDIATYECHGKPFVRSSTRQCLANGRWSVSNTLCPGRLNKCMIYYENS